MVITWEEVKRDITKIPNLITMTRICFVPIFYGLGYAGYWILFLVLGTILVLTDWLDGWVAKTYQQITRLGKFLDPIADKLIFHPTIWLLFLNEALMPLAIFATSTDLFSTFHRGTKAQSALECGRWKFGFQAATLAFFSLSKLTLEHTITQNINFILLGNICLLIANTLAIISIAQKLQSK